MELQFVKDQYYWIEDNTESYVAGRLLNAQPTQNSDYQFELYSTSRIVWINKSQISAMIPSPGEITLKTLYDDLTDAIDISEASVLWNLRQRYQIHNIYSGLLIFFLLSSSHFCSPLLAIGPILIAINPYCYLKDLYSQEKLDTYLNASGAEHVVTHIWAIARTAYLQLKEKHIRQAIVISGESGAGKTETTKKCLQYLSAASMGHNKAASTGQTAIEDRVLGSNPLLESFGNSKTCRNNNSSRFGKWLEINFNCGRGKFNLIGANITQYLLEKSRVVSQAEDERNYHVFYQMCSDESMGLGLPENYVYLNQSGCTSIEGVDDYQDFQETKKAFHDLHFPGEFLL
jgi:myosin heavy subunit